MQSLSMGNATSHGNIYVAMNYEYLFPLISDDSIALMARGHISALSCHRSWPETIFQLPWPMAHGHLLTPGAHDLYQHPALMPHGCITTSSSRAFWLYTSSQLPVPIAHCRISIPSRHRVQLCTSFNGPWPSTGSHGQIGSRAI